jgi:hypothetical protein
MIHAAHYTRYICGTVLLVIRLVIFKINSTSIIYIWQPKDINYKLRDIFRPSRATVCATTHY